MSYTDTGKGDSPRKKNNQKDYGKNFDQIKKGNCPKCGKAVYMSKDCNCIDKEAE